MHKMKIWRKWKMCIETDTMQMRNVFIYDE